jgi:hypothetical protein
MNLFLDRFLSYFYQNVQNILQYIYNKAFWEISILVMNELPVFIFEPLVYKFMEKILRKHEKTDNLKKRSTYILHD